MDTQQYESLTYKQACSYHEKLQEQIFRAAAKYFGAIVSPTLC